MQLGYMFRYNAGFQFILDWVWSGRLGDIFSVRGRIASGGSTEAEWERWDSRGEREGGIMFILACHLIDIFVALLGRPNRVTPFLRNEDKAFPWYRDNTASIFEYPGAMAIIESTGLEVLSGASRRLEVYGTRAARSLNRLNRRHYASVSTKRGMAMPKAGRRCRWKIVHVMSKAFARSLRIFGARNHQTVPSITNSPFRRLYFVPQA